VPFRSPGPRSGGPPPDRQHRPGTFDFLGFTHYWGRSRKGNAVVKRKTARSRFRRALLAISEWCRRHLHRPVAEQHQTLGQKLQGHYAYYGLTGNYRSLRDLYYAVTRVWRRWLPRRSWAGWFSWASFRRLWRKYPLPPPRVVHSVYRAAAN